jgi:hypothetical protein
MHFTVSRPQKKIRAQPGGEAASPPACTIRAFIGLHGQNASETTRIWDLFVRSPLQGGLKLPSNKKVFRSSHFKVVYWCTIGSNKPIIRGSNLEGTVFFFFFFAWAALQAMMP